MHLSNAERDQRLKEGWTLVDELELPPVPHCPRHGLRMVKVFADATLTRWKCPDPACPEVEEQERPADLQA